MLNELSYARDLTRKAWRDFNAKREEKARQLLGLPAEVGFTRANMRMVTLANCPECKGSGVVQEITLPPQGCGVLTLTECSCLRYERVDVRTPEVGS